jgi:hypothetical protein
MAIYDATFSFYDKFFEALAEDINLESDTLIIGLVTDGYTPDLSAHTQLSDITNEVSGSGYARQTLASVTFSQTGGVATLDFANPVFTATGGDITARRFFIYNDTTTTKYLIGVGLIDDGDADVTTTNGNTLTLNVNASGFFRIRAAA